MGSVFRLHFDLDVSGLDEGLLAIPCLSAILPAAWVLDASVRLPALDERYARAAEDVRVAFNDMYQHVSFAGSLAPARVTSAIPAATGARATLFSGGVDSWATVIAHQQERPVLFTVVDDSQLRDGTGARILRNTRAAAAALGLDSHEITGTIQDATDGSRLSARFGFDGWWGNVQHTFTLTGICAPVASLLGVESFYVPGSNYEGTEWLAWGSDPRVDDRIAWGTARVTHDLYELGRQGKLDLLAEHLTGAPHMRFQVCQRPAVPGVDNCSECEKCCRTMLGLALAGIDPCGVGFSIGPDTWRRMRGELASGRLMDSDSSLVDWAQIRAAAATWLAPNTVDPELSALVRWMADAPLERIVEDAKRRGRLYAALKRASLVLPNPVRRPLRRAVVSLRGEKA